MEIAIYDKKGVKVDILQNTTSIQWRRKYNETGDFEIHAKGTEANIKLLTTENRLVNQDTNEIGFITYVFPDVSSSGEEDIEVRGYLNNLDDRINPNTVTITTVETGLYKLVNDNKRGLDITTADAKGLSEKITDGIDTTWKTLRESFEAICQATGLGFRMVRKDGKMNVIELYKRGIVDTVKFSDEIGNIVTQSYLDDISSYKNYAYVACQGKSEERLVYKVDVSNGGPIKELYVDARDLSWTYQDDKKVEHTYTADQYKNNAIKRGMEKLEECAAIREFTADISSGDTLFVFRKDYDLGDVIPVKSVKYGIAKQFRISEIDEIQEDDGSSYKITLSNYDDELKKKNITTEEG